MSGFVSTTSSTPATTDNTISYSTETSLFATSTSGLSFQVNPSALHSTPLSFSIANSAVSTSTIDNGLLQYFPSLLKATTAPTSTAPFTSTTWSLGMSSQLSSDDRAPAGKQDEDEEVDVEALNESQPTNDDGYTPLVKLTDSYEVKSGEEDEKDLFSNRGKLYRYDQPTKAWKERGVGIIKILQHNVTGKIRVLMRREHILKICCNHYITSEMELTPLVGNNTSWTWTTLSDFSDEEAKVEKLCIRFKLFEVAQNFQKVFTDCVQKFKNSKSKESNNSGDLSVKFAPKAGSWECDDCSVFNEECVTQCIACGFINPNSTITSTASLGGSSLATSSGAVSFGSFKFGGTTLSMETEPASVPPAVTILSSIVITEDDVKLEHSSYKDDEEEEEEESSDVDNIDSEVVGSSTSNLSTRFARKPGDWECNSCFISNEEDTARCIACGSTNPNITIPAVSSSNTTTVSTSFGSGFKLSGSLLPGQPSQPTPTGIVFGGQSSGGIKLSSLIAGTSNTNTVSSSSDSIFKLPVSTQNSEPTSAPGGFKLDGHSSSGFKLGGLNSGPLPCVNLFQVPSSSSTGPLLLEEVTGSVSTTSSASFNLLGDFKLNMSTPATTDNTISYSTETSLFATTTSGLSFQVNQSALQSTPLSFSIANSAVSTSTIDNGLLQHFPSLLKATTAPTSTAPFISTTWSLGMSSQLSSDDRAPAGKQDEDEVVEALNELQPTDDDVYTPLVKLTDSYEVKSGEEDEKDLFSNRGKLYRYDQPTKAWKERGVGIIKILQHNVTGKIRVLMRREHILKICCNHYITGEMELTPLVGNNTSWTWTTLCDFSDEEAKVEKLCIRFKLFEVAQNFQKIFTDCVQKFKNGKSKENTNSGDLSVKFATKAVRWKCNKCSIFNEECVTQCVACGSINPNSIITFTASLGGSSASSGAVSFGSFKFGGTTLSMGTEPASVPTAVTILSSTVTTEDNIKPEHSSYEDDEEEEEEESSNVHKIVSEVIGNSKMATSNLAARFAHKPGRSSDSIFKLPVNSKPASAPGGFKLGGHSSGGFKLGGLNIGPLPNKPPTMQSDNDCVVTGELKSSEEDIELAQHYNYRIKPFPGCRACEDDSNVPGASDVPTTSDVPATSDVATSDGNTVLPVVTSTQLTTTTPVLFGASGGGLQSFASLANTAEFQFGCKEDKKGFAGAGTMLFQSQKPEKEDSEDNVNPEAEVDVDFKPLVSLPDTYQVTTGQESEKQLFCERAKLYRWDPNSKQWKERGIGNMTIMKNSESGKSRLVMRREQVLKLCCNHVILPTMQLNPILGGGNAWRWFTPGDFSEDEPKAEQLAIRFKKKEQADSFQEVISRCIQESTAVTTDQEDASGTAPDDEQQFSADIKFYLFEMENKVWERKGDGKVIIMKTTSGMQIMRVVDTSNCVFYEQSLSSTCKLTRLPSEEKSWSWSYTRSSTSEKTRYAIRFIELSDSNEFEQLVCDHIITIVPPHSQRSPEIPPLSPSSSCGGSPSQGRGRPLIEAVKLVGVWCCSNCNTKNPASDPQCIVCGASNSTPSLLSPTGVQNDNPFCSRGKPVDYSMSLLTSDILSLNNSIAGSEGPRSYTPFSITLLQHQQGDNESDGSSSLVSVPSQDGSSVASTEQQQPVTRSLFQMPTFTVSETKFLFPLLDTTVSDNSSLLNSTQPDNKEEEHPETEANVFFDPVVSLPSDFDTKSGEENEECVFTHRAKLYRYDRELKMWKDRGIGNIKILRHKISNKGRILMRREQVLKLCCNHYIVSGMTLKPGSYPGCSWVWLTSADYSEEVAQSEMLCVKFKYPEVASDFKNAFYTFASNTQNSNILPTVTLPEVKQKEVLLFSSDSEVISFADLASTAANSSASGFGGIGFGSSDNKGFAGAGKPLFSIPADKENETVDTFESTAEFKPIVKLSSDVTVQSGEENEMVLFFHRAKLYRFDVFSKQWKERGIGDIKILKHKQTGKCRILMRRDQILKLCCNHLIVEGMTMKARDEKSLQWMTLSDFSDEEAKAEQFTIRFKLAETADTFQKIFNDCLSNADNAEGTSLNIQQSVTTEGPPQTMSLNENVTSSDSTTASTAIAIEEKPGITSCSAAMTATLTFSPISTALATPTTVNNNVTSLSDSTTTSTVSTIKEQAGVTSCSATITADLTSPPIATSSTTPATNSPVLVFGCSSNKQSEPTSPLKFSSDSNTGSFNFTLKPASSEPNVFGSANLGTFNFMMKSAISTPNIFGTSSKLSKSVLPPSFSNTESLNFTLKPATSEPNVFEFTTLSANSIPSITNLPFLQPTEKEADSEVDSQNEEWVTELGSEYLGSEHNLDQSEDNDGDDNLELVESSVNNTVTDEIDTSIASLNTLVDQQGDSSVKYNELLLDSQAHDDASGETQEQ